MADAGEAGNSGGGAPAPTGGLDINTGAAAPSPGLAGPPPVTETKAPETSETPPAAKGSESAKPAPRAPAPTIADVPAKPEDKAEKPPVQTDWPQDWREKLAGDNKKLLDRFARFKSPNDVANAWIAMEQKLSSGQYVKKLASHHTDAELAEFRKSNNIPEKAEEYEIEVPGYVWGETDKPMLDSWKQFAHENNLPPDLAKLGPEWYVREQERMIERLDQQDMTNYQLGTTELQAKWGREFNANLNAAKNLFEAFPGMWGEMINSRGPDGMRLGDNPKVLDTWATLAREANPYATMAPAASGNDPGKTVESRMREITALMRDKGSIYWRGPDANRIQTEYRELIEMQQRAGARGQKAA